MVSRLPAVAACLLLAACQESPTNPPLPDSAVIETRDTPSARELEQPTRVVMLGTGTPVPDRNRAGASIAVVHRGQAYLFDVGAGAVRNATRARYRHDIPSLYPSQICCVFLTHLHSDHTLDYGELAFTLWWRRSHQLRAFGPEGLDAMTAALYEMMAPDTRLRTSGTQPVPNRGRYEVQVGETGPGVVFDEDGLLVEAFPVNHGDVEPAYGYRITTDDRTIVISGDTAYSEKLIEMARGADLLFHEVISDAGLSRTSEAWQGYHRAAHTPASELARVATAARPGVLVLYHVLFFGVPEPTIVKEVEAGYDGKVVLADDLDIF